ncbi:MAG: Peptidoglycan synthetase FtsI [candidate division TM6 bacterium GW2011_GWE2_41_16]|nr:MAG: Peptidoglycan synthetase FtsI [candidate division TM6 bacterium GW2011_GWE2_41_16]
MESGRKGRIVFLFCGVLLWACAIVYVLFSLQVRHKAMYQTLAQNQYSFERSFEGPRGLILDSKGQILAGNKDVVSAFITPRSLADKQRTLAFLRQHFPQAAQKFKEHEKKCFMYIKRTLSDSEIKLVESHPDSGILLIKEPGRLYPVEATRNVIGFVSIDNDGLSGIEKIYNAELKGCPSFVRAERDGRVGSIFFNKETLVGGSCGKSVQLTINSDIQYAVYDLVKETVENAQALEGAAMVVDPTTGGIIAMVQYPVCDPECATFDPTHTKNICVTDAYERGSIIKPFCALAALDEGVVDENTIIDCFNTRETYLYHTRISTVIPLGKVPLRDVIGFSNNMGMVQLGHALGERLWEAYKKYGFTSKTGLEVLGEQQGYMTPLKLWTRPTPLSLSFGYEISITLAQLVRGFCLFARDGEPVDLHICVNSEKNMHHEPVVKHKKSIDLMRSFLQYTVEKGAAKRAGLKGYTVMGKTGTARLAVPGGYDPKKHVLSFGGIVEKGSYKRVIVVFIKEPKALSASGSNTAAPLFRSIVQFLVTYDRVLPVV